MNKFLIQDLKTDLAETTRVKTAMQSQLLDMSSAPPPVSNSPKKTANNLDTQDSLPEFPEISEFDQTTHGSVP